MADVIGGANKRQHQNNASFYKAQFDRTRRNKKRKIAKALKQAEVALAARFNTMPDVWVGGIPQDKREYYKGYPAVRRKVEGMKVLERVFEAWRDPFYRSSKDKCVRQGGFYKYA